MSDGNFCRFCGDPTLIDQIATLQSRLTASEAECAQLREMARWIPIELAPKDGTWILAINAAPSKYPSRPHVVHYSERHSTKFPWVTDSAPMSFVGGLTHWMPLPSPPTQQSATTKGEV